ncbi:MAG: leucine-rich repeat domain-containing protein [Oscillospiraceae bacterium]|nr:leucine-rich repeat domain-containing protein [Oscillospiraceae bacterium]
MKHLTKLFVLLIAALVVALCLFASPTEANAATEGYYTYEVSNGEATITDVDSSISGNITIPSTLGGYPVTTIGDYAFYYCTGLTSVIIPDSVTTIGVSAFECSDSLTSVTIPDSVTSIGDYAFDGCTSLRFNTYKSGKYLGNNNNPYLLLVDVESKDITTFEFPAGTKLISSALRECTELTSLTIPDSVTSIGNFAFEYCTGLTSITIPESVTSIGYYAFYNCTSLTSVTIGDGVTSIGENTFYNCISLSSVTIGNSVTSIGQSAFSCCTSLTSVSIPDSVTSIGKWAFSNCISLKYNEYKGGLYLGNSANPYMCLVDMESTYITEFEFHFDTRIVGADAFRDCSRLTSITIPDSVISGVCKDAFRDCTSLTSVTIGNGVTSIGVSSFADCTSLTSVTIGNSVTSIGDSAFYDCTSLTSVTIPESVTSIGQSAFSRCTSLISIWVDENNSIYSSDDCGVLFNKDQTKLILAPCRLLGSYAIPDSVTNIGYCAFEDCTSLTSVSIPDSVANIGYYAFEDCTNLTGVYITDLAAWCNISFDSGANPLNYAENLYLNGELLTDMLVPDGVTSIGDYAFYNCASLTGVTVSNSVIGIGEHSFAGCTSLTSVMIGDSVTTIGDYAFDDCTSLTSVTIPDGVTSIGDYAFNWCESLTSVTIPNSITSIGYDAFENCTSLIYNEYKNGKYLGNNDNPYLLLADTVSTDIATFEFSSGTKLIGSSAFRDCTELTSLTIPGSVTAIGDDAFYSCSGLISVIIPGSVTSIGSYVFGNCTNLENIIIPDGVTSIDLSAFAYCDSLVSITIPHSVTRISNWAFISCDNLSHVAYTGTEYQWGAIDIGFFNDALIDATRHYETSFACVDDCEVYSVYCPVCQKYLIENEKEGGNHSYADGICTTCQQVMSGYVVLSADMALSGLVLTEDLYIDLNGHDLSGIITTNGYKVYGMDSATNEYTCDAMGYFNCVDENGNAVIPESLYTTENQMRYMTIGTDNGYTFHHYYLGITNLSLAPAVTGFGYKAEFYGDEMVQSKIESIGYNLWLDGGKTVSRTTNFKNSLTLRLKNFDVAKYGETPVNACVTITLTDGTEIESSTASYSMRQMVETVNDQYADLNETQLSAIQTMIVNNPTMRSWLVENIYKES